MSTARQYELIYITAPDVTDEVLADLHNQIVAIAERFGGTVSKTENWGRTRLAYEIYFRQSRPARGCLAGYPFQYVTKTGEGTYRGSLSGWLVIAPRGIEVGSPGATWCGPVTRSCL